MGFTFPLFIVTVLICSSAVSSTISDDVDKEVEAIVLQPDQLSCSTCNLLSLIMKEKFESIKREEMVERMLHSCYSLQVLSETCVNVVTNYFDDIYDLVKEQLQSNAICAISGICADNELQMESEELQSERKHDEFYCVECKKIVKHVHESLIKNLTEAQFKKMLMGSCTLTRNLKTECLRVVDQYSHVIYSMLINDLNSEGVCLLIGVCHDKRKEDVDLSTELQLSLDSDEDAAMPQCLLCKSVFRIIKKIITKHISKQDLKSAMEHACDKLERFSHRCHDFVDKHGDDIIRFVRSPTVICSILTMCIPIGKEAIDNKLGVPLPYEIDDPKYQFLAYNSVQDYSEGVQLITDALTKDSENCVLCKTIIKRLQNMVKDHHDINNALKIVCQMLMDQNQRDKCQIMIDKHTDLIEDLVSKNVAHQQICRSLSMCLLLDQENDNDMFEQEMPQPVVQEYSKVHPKCNICKAIMNAFKEMIHHGKDEIKRALSQVCHKAGKRHHMCEAMVNKHSDQIVDLLLKHTPTDKICKIIGMCHKSASEENFEIEEELSKEQNNQIANVEKMTASPKCSICKKLVKSLKKKIQHYENKGSIQKAMLKICSKLGIFSNKCQRIVQKDANKIIDLLVKNMANERICSIIGLCKGPIAQEDFEIDEFLPEEVFADSKAICEFWDVFLSDEIDIDNQLEEPTDPKDGPLCLICELLIARLKVTVDTKAKRDEIVHSILYTCNHLPSFIREPCHSIVQGYGYAVLDLISKVTPHEVCSILQTSAYETSSADLGF